ncbi:Ig-like domain repeat protein [Nocardioides baculatus]|uniref:Ig-like domain repeat protein n=1 Tax=Nocardioides baculatus TaxID=2801337 RepID=A0ABS1LFB5_9ACTN|nr:Ig-like domain repeat protein [Nocardioides baculatus]MBL0749421.1 Ig-like domain repeat protein [Nocardioides baculatus]
MRRLAVRAALPALSVLLGVGAGLPATAQTGGDRSTTDVRLDHPARGARAVRLLGSDLDEAAARNEMSAAALTDLLTSDPSAWVDNTGTVFFTDTTTPAPADEPVVAEAPLDQTFELHSKPGSTKTIYLDFDGGSASATGWHASYPTTPITQPAWDPAGNGAPFTSAELAAVQTVWEYVAEDYAPFDVDVTTADPGPAGIHRSGVLDAAYGSHVLITPSVGAQEAICPTGCGGVAYIGVFGTTSGGAGGDGYGYRQPAWVFPQKLGNSPKNIAEAATHEVGHNLGLRHDGNSMQSYDRGHGAWAPIMGVGYDHPITQWSKGDYAGATTTEDDVAIIRSVVGERVDEAPSGILGAPSLPASTSYVSSRTDVDTFLLGTCSGSVTVAADPLPAQANLDIELTLIDALGQVVATADPTSTQTSLTTASGMGASLTRTVDPGLYYVSVDGVGNGPWSTGYDDYGSLGAYTMALSGCLPTPTPTPTLTGLDLAASGRSVTLTATPTTTLGSLVGDVVFTEGATEVGRATLGVLPPAVTLTSVEPGMHTYTATFVPLGTTHVGSVSPARSVTVQVWSTTGLTATASGRDVTLDVRVATDGGAPAGTVELRDGGALVGTRDIVAGAASMTLASVTPGEHAYRATFVPSEPASYVGSTSPVRELTIAADPVPTTTAPVAPVPPPATPTATPTAAPTAAPTAGMLSTSTTTIRAPRKAGVGSRPRITVSVVRGAAPARGTVVVKVGRRRTTLTLVSGTARLRLPRLEGTKVKLVARYRGDATTSASSATRSIRVVAD